MCKISSMITAVLTLISSPRVGTQSPGTTESSVSEASAGTTGVVHVFPDQLTEDSITYNPLTNGESTEEQQGYSTYYNIRPTVNFHDIYSNSLALLVDDPMGTTAKNDDPLANLNDDGSFHLNNLNTRFVEFHPKTQTIPPVSNSTSKYALNASNVNIDGDNSTTTNTSTTTEEPDEVNVEVIPIKKEDYERGLLDLLFPASRVRTFKSVFDSFKRLMSHTFR